MKEKETPLEKLGRFINIAANAIMMNVMFLLACIPIVTIGAAWNGLFSAIRYNIRGEKWFEGFKFGYKTRFWRSLVSWVIMLIPIAIVLFFDVRGPLMDQAFLSTMTADAVVRLVFACLMALMLTGMCAALILLNVYIPTGVSTWVSNAANMVFKAPLQMAAVGLLMWFPLLLAFLSFQYFFYFIMVFIVVYYMLAALGITMLMKNTLLDFLVEARSAGTLIDEREEESEERQDDNDEQDPE
ncbi:MAG: YesL family protein [Oscillospiraceae bacterium]|nr:YesL family protein [Oscillospiraceae bacterium]